MKSKYKTLKTACYMVNVSMAVVVNLPPLLFLTFRNMYGISYSLIGLLVLINYVTQLGIDLIFSFFSHRFNIPKTVKLTPVLTVFGLVLYALLPLLFPNHVYIGLVIGTVVFSASAGLVEVLISPVIAAIPAEDPDREMSKLHSVYAWGVVFIVIFATAFFILFGAENWQYLMLILTVIPLTSALLYMKSEIPEMETPERVSGALAFLKNKTLWLCVAAIFLGGATECTMAQWASGYIEEVFSIPKVYGDVFGVALFALMLGIGRTLYSKVGKNAERILLIGAAVAAVCYLTAALTNVPFIGLFACAFTGLCVSMLWPGSLIVASEKFPYGGVFIFAMMASGGDLGASVGPQLIGVIADFASKNEVLLNLASSMSVSGEQLGLKIGMLAGSLFPLLALPVYYSFCKQKRKN